MTRSGPLFFVLLASVTLMATSTTQVDAQDADLQAAIKVIQQIQPGGESNDEAIKAMEVLNHAVADDVPFLLEGMDGASKLALNWLRGAIQTALDKGEMPERQIMEYFNDHSRSQMGRLMAFELLSARDESFAERNIPGLIEDPSLPLRQMGVANWIGKAEEAEAADAIGMLGYVLTKARDVEQVEDIAERLGEHGLQVDLQKQLGAIAQWQIVGPFDNTDEAGFEVAYGPETDPANIDIEASYADSKTGEPVSWMAHNTLSQSGVVDLNEILGNEKGAIAYAWAEFESAEDQDVEIRIGCINANRVWVNGVEVINNEVYHVGMQTDQFSGATKLVEGKNSILFKVCQNEQEQPWAQNWMFQLRICDTSGQAVTPVAPVAGAEE
ncbi:MAG: hypothetical protein ACR2NP_21620 [Pirellulaceae bacterium]